MRDSRLCREQVVVVVGQPRLSPLESRVRCFGDSRLALKPKGIAWAQASHLSCGLVFSFHATRDGRANRSCIQIGFFFSMTNQKVREID